MQGTPALACVRFSPDGGEIGRGRFRQRSLRDRRRRSRKARPLNATAKTFVLLLTEMTIASSPLRVARGDLHLFDPISGRLLSDHALHRGRIHDVAFHRQSNAAVCVAEDGTVTVFDTENRQLKQRIPVTTGKLFAVAILNSQLVAVAGSDNLIRIVNTDEGNVIRKLEGHAGSVSDAGLQRRSALLGQLRRNAPTMVDRRHRVVGTADCRR